MRNPTVIITSSVLMNANEGISEICVYIVGGCTRLLEAAFTVLEAVTLDILIDRLLNCVDDALVVVEVLDVS